MVKTNVLLYFQPSIQPFTYHPPHIFSSLIPISMLPFPQSMLRRVYNILKQRNILKFNLIKCKNTEIKNLYSAIVYKFLVLIIGRWKGGKVKLIGSIAVEIKRNCCCYQPYAWWDISCLVDPGKLISPIKPRCCLARSV